MTQNLLPLAEHFHSIMGEGVHTGVPMHFIRLSGCPVGAKATNDYLGQSAVEPLPILSNGRKASKCRTYDGRFFTCDTEWRKPQESLSATNLIEQTYERHICLTGGEPFAHKDQAYFAELCQLAYDNGIEVHVETSGTIYDDYWWSAVSWIACAPKWLYDWRAVKYASEVKILVDESFDISKVPSEALTHKNLIFSPINGETEVNQANVNLALQLLEKYPHARLSCQWHKFLHLR